MGGQSETYLHSGSQMADPLQTHRSLSHSCSLLLGTRIQEVYVFAFGCYIFVSFTNGPNTFFPPTPSIRLSSVPPKFTTF